MLQQNDEPQYVLPHDISNALILPASRKQKKQHRQSSAAEKQPQKTLSKKKVKKLKKILAAKQKKSDRYEIYAKLQEHSLNTEEYKKLLLACNGAEQSVEKGPNERCKGARNSIAGSRKASRLSGGDSCSQTRPSTSLFASDSFSSSDSDSDTQEEDLKREQPTATNSVADPSETKPDEGVVFWSKTLNSVRSSSRKGNETTITLESRLNGCETSEKSCSKEKVSEAQAKDSPEEHVAQKLPARRTVHVPVFRSEETNKFRNQLPVVGQEQEIVEAVLENDVVIVCGETGSGKTTQVPQFLYEANFCGDGRLVGVTEPRRIAAVSMSARVAQEMNLSTDVVSYQIRYEGNASDKTRVKFMTDGVLLKEVQRDLLLVRYSAVIVDEAHERSVYSDILIGLLSRIVTLRAKRGDPLKLIIMSATLNVTEFVSDRLFRTPPVVIKVPSRMFPVSVHFSRRTEQLYLNSAYRMVVQIHRYMPNGGILVFVSGRKEVCLLIKWLRSTFTAKAAVSVIDDGEVDEQTLKAGSNKNRKRQRANRTNRTAKNISLDNYDIDSFLVTEEVDPNERDACDGIGDASDDEYFMTPDLDPERQDSPLYCLPLYSMLPNHKQKQIYDPPPPGSRFCIVATNVAETSLTIPHIRYVVDTGKEKVRLYDAVTGASKFVVQWISKASANQRAGRAGRVAPGECYRLYSSAVFSEFPEFSVPEIMNKPPDELVLQMKCMNIIKVQNFPFPTPPSAKSLQEAESRLCKLGLLEACKDAGGSERTKINRLGQTVACFPVSPQYGKMISLADQHGLLPYVICLVAALSVREPLATITESCDTEERRNEAERLYKLRLDWAGSGQSFLLGDLAVLLNAVLQFEADRSSADACEKLGMRFKAMKEVHQLRKQLTNITGGVFPQLQLALDANLPPLTMQQCRLLRQLVLSCQGSNLAKKYEFSAESSDVKLKNSYCSGVMKEPLWIHPSSVLCKRLPTWLVYQEIIDGGRKYMFNVMAVESEWLPQFANLYL